MSWVHNGSWLLTCLTAYCAQPILVDLIKFHGGAHASTFLFLLPHYLSMVCVGFYPTEPALSDLNWPVGILLSSLDITNQLLKKGGLVYAGAAAYIVVDSSSIVWTAMWSKALLNTRLTALQWTGLTLITVGIAIKARAMNITFEDEEFFGVFLVLVSSVLMGLMYVLNQKYMHSAKPICGPTLVFMMGVCCSAIMTVWTLVWTVPRRHTLITERISDKGGDPKVVIVSFLGLFMAGVLHSGTFWYILSTYGAVSSGVLKGAKVTIVFLLSHIFFCKYQSSQCLNRVTVLSCLVCVGGVCLYSYATSQVVEREVSEGSLGKRDRWRWLYGTIFGESGEVVDRRAVTGGRFTTSLPSLAVCGGISQRRRSSGDVYKLSRGDSSDSEVPSKQIVY